MGYDKEEIEVRNFLSSRKDTDNHISQLLDIASLLRLSIRGHDIDDLFSAISDELDKNPSSIDKVYEFLKDKRLVKESLTIKKLKDIIRECLSEI